MLWVPQNRRSKFHRESGFRIIWLKIHLVPLIALPLLVNIGTHLEMSGMYFIVDALTVQVRLRSYWISLGLK